MEITTACTLQRTFLIQANIMPFAKPFCDQKNLEKSKKKHAKKDAVSAQVMNEMAQKKTRQTTSNNNVDSYKSNAKPGSLASKANMVSDFNNKK